MYLILSPESCEKKTWSYRLKLSNQLCQRFTNRMKTLFVPSRVTSYSGLEKNSEMGFSIIMPVWELCLFFRWTNSVFCLFIFKKNTFLNSNVKCMTRRISFSQIFLTFQLWSLIKPATKRIKTNPPMLRATFFPQKHIPLLTITLLQLSRTQMLSLRKRNLTAEHGYSMKRK